MRNDIPWTNDELLAWLDKTNWTLSEPIVYDSCPDWLKSAMKKRCVRGVISYSSREKPTQYTFRGRHYIYTVISSYFIFSISRQPRGLTSTKLSHLIELAWGRG